MMRAAPPLDYAAMPIAEARDAWNAFQKSRQGEMRACASRDLTVGGVACRLLNAPAGPDLAGANLAGPGLAGSGLIVFVHGGGWTFGSPSSHEEFGRELAVAAGMPVLLPDYRLAPEHRCPAAIEDVLAVLAALPPQRKLVLGGDSSGANVALAVAQTGVRLDLLSLWYGCFAPLFDTESHRTCGDGSFGLATDRMRWYWDNWLSESTDPRGIPLERSMEGLPRTHVLAAGLDCLRDDSMLLAGKLAAAGVSTRLDVVAGVIHGFLQMPGILRPAREATATIADEIKRTLNNTND